ncbi:hypothetical protein E4U54_003038 [Claviceps lovelessii]|nr:hypothetical protein E4U54_003038 [Claviceps lovelessii]
MDEKSGLGAEVSHFDNDGDAAAATVTVGSLSLAPSTKAFHQAFAYSTTEPNSKNWVGVYPSSGGGPDEQKYNQDSLSWEYAPGEDGVVNVSTANLPPGHYKAYLLADEGYTWLAQPVVFAVSGPWGSVSVIGGGSGPALTFAYRTPHADSENWIGIYHSFGGGPEWQRRLGDSLAWAYAPDESGTVTVNATKLQPGLSYRVYFLAKGRYKWLANPIDIFSPGRGRLAFITDAIRTHNARRGERFEASVGGMLDNPPDGATRFAKAKDLESTTSQSQTDGGGHDGWVKVLPDGTISGIPPEAAASADSTTFVVEALASDGSTAEMRITIPLVPRDEPLVEELTVLSFNLWFGGTQVKDYHAKQVRFIADSGADIVGLQESTGGHAVRLGQALGWHCWQGNDVGVISRYPIVKINPAIEAAGSVRIALDRGHRLSFWNCHLGYTPYGPYDVCFDHLPGKQVLRNEERSRRTPQIKNMMRHMRQDLRNANQHPVILTGDFNAPSHLDWTDATKHLHCGTGFFPWPTSRRPVDAGLRDSFREVHPDPLAEPGITWSPIYLDNDGRCEPTDRIDFIYHKGLQTLSSQALVVGNPRPQPDHYENEWPSDHAAVRTVFRVRRPRSGARARRGLLGAIVAVMSSCAACFGSRRPPCKKSTSPDLEREKETDSSSDTVGSVWGDPED